MCGNFRITHYEVASQSADTFIHKIMYNLETLIYTN